MRSRRGRRATSGAITVNCSDVTGEMLPAGSICSTWKVYGPSANCGSSALVTGVSIGPKTTPVGPSTLQRENAPGSVVHANMGAAPIDGKVGRATIAGAAGGVVSTLNERVASALFWPAW